MSVRKLTERTLLLDVWPIVFVKLSGGVKNIINFEFTKGSILFSINKKSKDNYNLNVFYYNLDDIEDVIILSKKDILEIIHEETNEILREYKIAGLK